METTTETARLRARAADRRVPGDRVGVPRRPREGGALEGPAGDRVRPAARAAATGSRSFPGTSRAASSSSSTGRAGSSTRGAGSRATDGPNPVPPGSSTVEIELGRRGRRHEAAVHAPRPAGRARPSSRTRSAGITTCERLAVVAAGGDPGPDPWLDGRRERFVTQRRRERDDGEVRAGVQGRQDAGDRGGAEARDGRVDGAGSAASATRSSTWATRSAPTAAVGGGSTSGLTGYSIVNADSLDDALAKAASCPILDGGRGASRSTRRSTCESTRGLQGGRSGLAIAHDVGLQDLTPLLVGGAEDD